MYGDAGDDTIYGGDASGNQSFGGDGDDSIVDGSGDAVLDGGAGNDFIGAGGGSDLFYGGDGDGADTITGEAGDDTIFGGAGADLLYGEDGADVFCGGAGDTVVGGEGGTDNDTLILNHADVQSISYGGGNNEAETVTFTAASGGGTLTFYEIETIRMAGQIDGTAGADSMGAGYTDADCDQIGAGHDRVVAGAGNDSIEAGAGDDQLQGGVGNDSLFGGDGDDTLAGDAGNDLLYGGAGSDTLSGGAGNDSLVGGDGADLFVFDAGGGGDVVAGFNVTLVNGKTLDQLDVSELRTTGGDPIKASDVIVSDDGNGNAVLTFPEGETIVLQGVAPKDVDSKQAMARMEFPCFGTGTLIRTPQGWRVVETLQAGARVMTHDGAALPILWVGAQQLTRCDLAANPHLLPVLCAPGSLGNRQAVLVSPQHCILMVLNGEEVFVRAIHLARAGFAGGRVAMGKRQVGYHHILLDRHAILDADGAAMESFYPGRMAMAAVQPQVQRAIAAVIGAGLPRDDFEALYGPRARRVLAGQQVAKVIAQGGLRRVQDCRALAMLCRPGLCG
jgi:Ca2+-binding RTX toxin-like protein